jgi:hypothetical protein
MVAGIPHASIINAAIHASPPRWLTFQWAGPRCLVCKCQSDHFAD